MSSDARRCEHEVSPQCPGHGWWEKFSDCLSEALYASTPNDQTGTVDGFGYWVALYVNDDRETIDGPDGLKVTIPAHTYAVITEDDRGSIGFDTYPTVEGAQAAYDRWDAAYGAYLDASEYREYAITSSTGRIGR